MHESEYEVVSLSTPPPLPNQRAAHAPRELPGNERRDVPRVELRADVSLYSEANFWSGYTEDVSEGGLFIATYALQPLGARVTVCFELPTGYTVRTTGVVRWVREPRAGAGEVPGMGVALDALTDADLAAIRSFVKHRAPLFYDE